LAHASGLWGGFSGHMEEEGAMKHYATGIDVPLIKKSSLPKDTFGHTYFQNLYGFDRVWILAFVVSALATPAVRFYDEYREGPHRKYDFPVWVDLGNCMLAMILVLSITRAVDTPAFIHMHREHGSPVPAFWAVVIKVLAVVNLLRPILPIVTGDSAKSNCSHSGGIFQVSAVIVAVPCGIEVYRMNMREARAIKKEIEEADDEGKWVRVLRWLQHFRTDLFSLWSLSSVGLPWCITILGCLMGAYSNGLQFLQTEEVQRAIFFFIYSGTTLGLLLPLASITTACSRHISSAATKWYPLQAWGDKGGQLPEDTFQAYTLVLRFIDRKFIGVRLLGFAINNKLLWDLAIRILLGLPSLYGAYNAVSHSKVQSQVQVQVQSQSED